MNEKQSNVPLWFHWARVTSFMTERFLGGPQILKLAWVINFQKTGTFFYILLLMIATPPTVKVWKQIRAALL